MTHAEAIRLLKENLDKAPARARSFSISRDIAEALVQCHKRPITIRKEDVSFVSWYDQTTAEEREKMKAHLMQ